MEFLNLHVAYIIQGRLEKMGGLIGKDTVLFVRAC